MASISLDLSGGSGSVECQANFNFQVSLVYFPIIKTKTEGRARERGKKASIATVLVM